MRTDESEDWTPRYFGAGELDEILARRQAEDPGNRTLAQLAILYLLLNAQFIAAVQVLIYAGAIMVLFLFVITLLGVQEYPFIGERLPFQRSLAVIFAGLLLFGVVYFVGQSFHAMTGAHGTFNTQLAAGNVQAFGTQLFTTFVFPFELTPLLLIVAMIGAVALGRGRRRLPTAVMQSVESTEVAAVPVLQGPPEDEPAGTRGERSREEIEL